MPRKILMMSSIFLVVLAVIILLVVLRPSDPVSENGHQDRTQEAVRGKKETTIRNVTEETVYYTIIRVGSPEKSEQRVLEVGAIDRFPGDYDLEVTFLKEGEYVTYDLDAGTPYSFRYDENNLLELYEGSHGREDAEDLAPFVPTPMAVVDRMLEMAEVDENTILYDLGCGDGRIVIQAAKKYSARGVGVDIDPLRIEESNAAAKKERVEHLVEFRLEDIMKVDFSEATVVTLYLLPESNEVLRPLLEELLKRGTYVVTHNYYIPGWSDKQLASETVVTEDGKEHDIYLYKR